MKVATRLTLATALVVTIATTAFAVFDVRGRGQERREAALGEARTLAVALRVTLESQGATARPLRELTQQLAASLEGWQVVVVEPAQLSPDQPAHLVAPPTGAQLSAGLARRAKAVLGAPEVVIADSDELGVHAGIALRDTVRGEAPGDRDGDVVAALLVSRSATALVAALRADRVGAVWLVILIVLVSTTVVGVLASSLVAGRIRKLLRGIDDVAKGDLSHVLLSDRDDEIGTLATRFNEMTFSLRESRAETERQNQTKLDLEQRLGQTERLATIGQLAAEIAHEVGTPLHVIAGRARSMQRKAGDPAAVEKNASIIAEQTARITAIIQRLLDFSRRKVGAAPKRVQLNEVSLTTMELLASQFASHRIKTRLSRAEGLPVVMGHADRLQQVLINLVLNAVQAMTTGGTLDVETAVCHRHRPGLENAGSQAFVEVRVADTGPGIPVEIRDKIFDPFFTTKEGSGGTGLGLAVCFGIVKEHDGWIEVDDRVEAGAALRVFLPAAAEESQ